MSSHINPEVGCRDKLPANILVENVSDAAQDSLRIIRAAIYSVRGYLNHRGDQCGRYTVSTNIGYENPDMALVGNEELIKVTSHSTHRFVYRSDFKARYLRRTFWKNRELQLPSDGKLIVQYK